MLKNAEYNPDALQRLAACLRRRAVFVVALWLVIGTLGGGYVGREYVGSLGAGIGAAVGAFAGYLIGSMRGLYYNVQAANALCLSRIEENTRAR